MCTFAGSRGVVYVVIFRGDTPIEIIAIPGETITLLMLRCRDVTETLPTVTDLSVSRNYTTDTYSFSPSREQL